MVEQSSTWLQIRRDKPDYVLIWGWGVMTPTAIKQAASIKFPVERLIGNWWSAAEPDVIPAGDAAKGYVGATFRMPGTEFGVYKDLENYVFGPGKGASKVQDRGTVLYNQGLLFAMILTEGMRAAQGKFGNHPVSGDQTRWGLENSNFSEARLKELGFDGMFAPIKLSCADHAGGGKLRLIQWDGKSGMRFPTGSAGLTISPSRLCRVPPNLSPRRWVARPATVPPATDVAGANRKVGSAPPLIPQEKNHAVLHFNC